MQSSSGGAFHASRFEHDQTKIGAVYGFALTAFLLSSYGVPDNEADLDWLRGSKYVQGSIGSYKTN